MVGALGTGIVGASIAAAFGALYLGQYLYRQRDRPGADWFLGNITAVALFCVTYGVGLLVFDPTVRLVLEAIAFVSVCFMGPFFLAFGLDYTGRGDLIRSPLFGGVAAVPLLTTGLAATNPVHQVVWTNVRFEPVLGLATVAYSIQPWGVFALLFSIGTAAVGSLLLIEAILSYGPLYRREATAVILSTAPPSIGVIVWLFGLGPVPQLHLTAPLMLIHVALDAYAFVGTHMFDTNPATQRMAEQTGLDSLSDPVLVLDTDDRIVRVNDRAAELFLDGAPETLPVQLETVLGVGVEGLRATGDLRVGTDHGGMYAVSYSPLTDPGGSSVGGMLVLYDVTEDRQREQQLAVLNRVLRHNVRNEMTLIDGYARLLTEELEDPTHAQHADEISVASTRLLSTAAKVQTFERIQDRARRPARLAIAPLVAEVAREWSATHDDATVDWTVTPPDLRVETDSVLVSVLLDNLVENAIVHSDRPAPTVTITVSETAAPDGEIVVEVRDSNDPIPEIEVETLRAGDETPLQHGQGIGFWIVYWCVQKLGGTVEFEYDDGNVLTVVLPN